MLLLAESTATVDLGWTLSENTVETTLGSVNNEYNCQVQTEERFFEIPDLSYLNMLLCGSHVRNSTELNDLSKFVLIRDNKGWPKCKCAVSMHQQI